MSRSEERADPSEAMNGAMNEAMNEAMTTSRPAKRKGGAARWARRIALALAALGVAAAIVSSFLPKPVPVDVAPATRGAMRVTVDEDGRTRVRERYIVASPLLGTLSRIELRAGDPVTEGQVVARLSPMGPPLLDARTRAEAQARVATAQAGQRQAESTIGRARTTAELARAELTRIEALAKSEAASAQQIDRARIEARSREEEVSAAEIGAQVAVQQLRQAEAVLAFVSGGRADKGEAFVVTSPTAGRILRVVQESGGPVSAGAPLVEIGDPARLEIVVDVLTADAVHVEPGARLSIERWGGSAALAGHVRAVEPSAFTRVSALGVEEQRVNVVIDLDEPREKWASLGDGYRVDARIVVWEDTKALQVPAGAVFRRGDGWAAFVVEGGKARLRSVEIGRRNGAVVQVGKGIEEGESVVMHPSDRVTDGVEVEVRPGG